jgi:hypothetical protein
MKVGLVSGFATVLTACLFATAGQAYTITMFDNTKNVSYHGASPYNSYKGGITSIGDVVEGGPEFDTQKVDITVTGTMLEFKFYTQFDGDDSGAHYTDISSP